MNKEYRAKRGFTVIELLIVISIIGILAAIILASMSAARAKGRDARRYRDIEEIHTAIELFIDNHGYAPDLGDANCRIPGADVNCFVAETDAAKWAILESQLSPYISQLSKDPCGVRCYDDGGSHRYGGYFSYYYAAPGNVGMALLPNGIPADSMSYRIYAQNMETKPTSYGFGAGSF